MNRSAKKRANKRKPVFAIFSSFKDENQAEYRRLRRMTPKQRLDEFSVLQDRVWGAKWTKERMKRIASVEKITW